MFKLDKNHDRIVYLEKLGFKKEPIKVAIELFDNQEELIKFILLLDEYPILEQFVSIIERSRIEIELSKQPRQAAYSYKEFLVAKAKIMFFESQISIPLKTKTDYFIIFTKKEQLVVPYKAMQKKNFKLIEQGMQEKWLDLKALESPETEILKNSFQQ